MLHATHPEPRFWAISVAGSTITLRTGPMHTPGTSRTIECKSGTAAITTAEALVAQRLKDGFRVAEPAKAVAAIDLATETALLRDDVDAWVVFADSLLESTEQVRGQFASGRCCRSSGSSSSRNSRGQSSCSRSWVMG